MQSKLFFNSDLNALMHCFSYLSTEELIFKVSTLNKHSRLAYAIYSCIAGRHDPLSIKWQKKFIVSKLPEYIINSEHKQAIIKGFLQNTLSAHLDFEHKASSIIFSAQYSGILTHDMLTDLTNDNSISQFLLTQIGIYLADTLNQLLNDVNWLHCPIQKIETPLPREYKVLALFANKTQVDNIVKAFLPRINGYWLNPIIYLLPSADAKEVQQLRAMEIIRFLIPKLDNTQIENYFSALITEFRNNNPGTLSGVLKSLDHLITKLDQRQLKVFGNELLVIMNYKVVSRRDVIGILEITGRIIEQLLSINDNEFALAIVEKLNDANVKNVFLKHSSSSIEDEIKKSILFIYLKLHVSSDFDELDYIQQSLNAFFASNAPTSAIIEEISKAIITLLPSFQTNFRTKLADFLVTWEYIPNPLLKEIKDYIPKCTVDAKINNLIPNLFFPYSNHIMVHMSTIEILINLASPKVQKYVEASLILQIQEEHIDAFKVLKTLAMIYSKMAESNHFTLLNYIENNIEHTNDTSNQSNLWSALQIIASSTIKDDSNDILMRFRKTALDMFADNKKVNYQHLKFLKLLIPTLCQEEAVKLSGDLVTLLANCEDKNAALIIDLLQIINNPEHAAIIATKLQQLLQHNEAKYRQQAFQQTCQHLAKYPFGISCFSAGDEEMFFEQKLLRLYIETHDAIYTNKAVLLEGKLTSIDRSGSRNI